MIKDGTGFRVVYDTVCPITGELKTVDQDDMLHFSSFGFNGLHSLSAIQHAAKQAIGNSLASAEYTGRTIGEGAMPQIALEFAGKMNPEQAKQLRDSFMATYTGVGARKLPLVLTEGGKVSELSISPVDLQLIESRRYEKEDICQALGVPPVIIGDNDKTSSWGTGIEQITLGFVKFTIKPMLRRWEEELNRKLFRNAGQFIEFELDGLLRGDSKAQAEVFKSALGGPGSGDGYMTVNEIRRLKNLPRMDGGDELFKAQRGTTSPSPAGTPA
jgi:HK97 family phage portal protein